MFMRKEILKNAWDCAVETAIACAKKNGQSFAYVARRPTITDTGDLFSGSGVTVHYNYFISNKDFGRVGFAQFIVD